MTMLKVGIADMHERREQMMRIVRGEAPREPNAPKLWFSTVESFVNTLSTGHGEFLREIVEVHVSVSLNELSRMTGQKRSDFGGMLNKLAEMGLIEMHLRDGRRLRSSVADGRVVFDALPNEETGVSNAQSGSTKRHGDESIGRERRVAAR